MAKGDLWLDYSGAAPISPSTLKSHNVKGVCRYIRVAQSGGSTDWKAITKGEFDDLINAGIDVWLNFEWYEARCMEGYSAGLSDGRDALAEAKSLGYARGATIVFSHDQGEYDNGVICDYLSGVQEGLGDYYRIEIYSGISVVDNQVTRDDSPPSHGWQTLAWSNGQVGVAKLLQNLVPPPIANTDSNEVLTDEPFGSHLQTLAGSGDSGGGDDMGTFETSVCHKQQPLTNAWRTVAVDDDGTQSWFRGPCTFQAQANVTVAGLSMGGASVVRFRWVTVDVRASDGYTKPDLVNVWPEMELIGTAGSTYGSVGQYGQISAPASGYQRRLRLQAYADDASGVAITYVRASSFRQ